MGSSSTSTAHLGALVDAVPSAGTPFPLVTAHSYNALPNPFEQKDLLPLQSFIVDLAPVTLNSS